MTVSAQRDPQALWRPLDPEKEVGRCWEGGEERFQHLSLAGFFWGGRGADGWAPESADPEVT